MSDSRLLLGGQLAAGAGTPLEVENKPLVENSDEVGWTRR